MLATEDGVFFGHVRLDERVSDPRAERRAVRLGDDLGNHLGTDQVVHHGSPRMLGQNRPGEECGGERTRHRLGLLVDQEHSIGVAIEGQPDVGADLEHSSLEVSKVLHVERVGRVVRKRAVELGIQEVDLEGQIGEGRRHHESAHAVGGVGHDLQRPEGAGVDETVDVADEGRQQICGASRAGRSRRRWSVALEHRLRCCLDGAEPGVLTNGGRTRAAHLDAVVASRVVRGGEHHTRHVEGSGGEVDHVGRRQTDLDHAEPLTSSAAGKRRDQLGSRRPHVATDHDLGGVRLRFGDVGGEPDPERFAHLGSDLVGVGATDVVGLDDGVERGHSVGVHRGKGRSTRRPHGLIG